MTSRKDIERYSGDSSKPKSEAEKDLTIDKEDFGKLINENPAFSDNAKKELKKNSGFISYLLGKDGISKLEKHSRYLEAKQGFEFRREVLRIAMDFKKKHLSDKYTQVLQQFQFKCRQETYIFAMEKIGELQEEIDKYEEQFYQRVLKKLRKAEDLKNEKTTHANTVAQRWVNSALEDLNRYPQFLKEIAKQYESIIYERVGGEIENLRRDDTAPEGENDKYMYLERGSEVEEDEDHEPFDDFFK